MIQVGFGSNGKFRYYDDGWKELDNYASNTWYRFQILSRKVNGKYDIYINGTEGKDDASLADSSLNFNLINFSTDNTTTGTFYLDDVNVTSACGYIISEELSLPTDQAWYTLSIGKTEDRSNTYINVAILDNATLQSIPGFGTLIGTEHDIYFIDPILYPVIRLKAEFIANVNSTPLLFDWEVLWADDPDPTHTTNITENEITYNGNGIYVNSLDTTIKSNYINWSTIYGIYLIDSDNNLMSNNSLSNNNISICLNQSDNNNITSNTVNSSNQTGIYLISSSNNNITSNVINLGSYTGINLSESSLNNIDDNTISNNTHGIWSNESTNTISNNTINNNTKMGIYFYNSDNSTIENNDIFWNDNNGILLNTSDNNTIINNTITANNNAGISLDSSNDSDIINNDISNNSIIGIFVSQVSNANIVNNDIIYNSNGLDIYYSSVLIQYNDISYNDVAGIAQVFYSNVSICNNTITYNTGVGIASGVHSNGTIDNNTITHSNYGIELQWWSCPTITYNNVTDNTNGIYIFEGSNATIHWNNIYDNTNYNLNNSDPNININATNNYWGPGSPSGIIGSVTYIPYQKLPVIEAGPQ